MPTSATSNCRQKGFTLLELLVVLTIIGLLSAAVMLASPPGTSSLREDGERLAARVRAAQEQSVTVNRPIRLNIGSDGYNFALIGGGSGVPTDLPIGERWAAPTTVEGARAIAFDPTGFAQPARIMLERGGNHLAVEISVDGGVNVRRPG